MVEVMVVFAFAFVYGLRLGSGMAGADTGTDVGLIEKAPGRRSFPDLAVVGALGAAGEVGAVAAAVAVAAGVEAV